VKIGPGRLRSLSIAGPFGRYPIAKNACRAIGCFSSSHFHADTWAMGKVQKIGKWVPHELNDRQTPKHMPNSACQTKKKVIPISDL